MGWNAVKVFSATKSRERAGLGEKITEWMREERVQPVDVEIRQSSDSEFHCLTIILFYELPGGKGR